jgi:hypothetical protein
VRARVECRAAPRRAETAHRTSAGAPVTVPLASFASGGLVRHAWIQDSPWDDGLTFDQAQLGHQQFGETRRTPAHPAWRHSGSQIFRGVIAPSSGLDRSRSGLVRALDRHRSRPADAGLQGCSSRQGDQGWSTVFEPPQPTGRPALRLGSWIAELPLESLSRRRRDVPESLPMLASRTITGLGAPEAVGHGHGRPGVAGVQPLAGEETP